MDAYKFSPFDDYIDYRLNRTKPRGALVRSLLNQCELDTNPAMANNAYSPVRANYGLGHRIPDDVTYRALPDVSDVIYTPSMTSYPTTWTSQRYPYSRTMDQLNDDLRTNRNLGRLGGLDAGFATGGLENAGFDSGIDRMYRDLSPAPTRAGPNRRVRFGSMEDLSSLDRSAEPWGPPSPTYYEDPRHSRQMSPFPARVVATTLDRPGFRDDHNLPDPIYSGGRSDNDTPYYKRPLDQLITPSFYRRPQKPMESRLRNDPNAYELGPEMHAKRRNMEFPFRPFHSSFTPYAPYKNMYQPVEKKLNPDWPTYKPYEYKFRQFRYVHTPKPYHTVKELEMERILKAKDFHKWFPKKERQPPAKKEEQKVVEEKEVAQKTEENEEEEYEYEEEEEKEETAVEKSTAFETLNQLKTDSLVPTNVHEANVTKTPPPTPAESMFGESSETLPAGGIVLNPGPIPLKELPINPEPEANPPEPEPKVNEQIEKAEVPKSKKKPELKGAGPGKMGFMGTKEKVKEPDPATENTNTEVVSESTSVVPADQEQGPQEAQGQFTEQEQGDGNVENGKAEDDNIPELESVPTDLSGQPTAMEEEEACNEGTIQSHIAAADSIIDNPEDYTNVHAATDSVFDNADSAFGNPDDNTSANATDSVFDNPEDKASSAANPTLSNPDDNASTNAPDSVFETPEAETAHQDVDSFFDKSPETDAWTGEGRVTSNEETPASEVKETAANEPDFWNENADQDQSAGHDEEMKTILVKNTGQTLVDERDLGENECIRTEYEVEEIVVDPEE